jgi:hypothetical protein
MLKQSSVEDEYRDPARVFWLRIKSKLLQRRQQSNQVEEARKMEDKLKIQLRFADADHPILLQLQHTEGK